MATTLKKLVLLWLGVAAVQACEIVSVVDREAEACTLDVKDKVIAGLGDLSQCVYKQMSLNRNLKGTTAIVPFNDNDQDNAEAIRQLPSCNCCYPGSGCFPGSWWCNSMCARRRTLLEELLAGGGEGGDSSHSSSSSSSSSPSVFAQDAEFNSNSITMEHENQHRTNDHQEEQQQRQLVLAKEYNWSKSGLRMVDNQMCLDQLVTKSAVGKCLVTAVTVLAGTDCPTK
ncbi:hypothetical protein ACA910_008841 [Epithemia clementina (nom. ined.)]